MGCTSNHSGRRVCPAGVKYLQSLLDDGRPRVALAACEGACSKGEVARGTANLVAYRLARDTTVRICLGDAITADSGFAEVLARAPQVVMVEGCSLCCGTLMLRQRFPELFIQAVVATNHYENDERKFEILDLDAGEALAHAEKVSMHVLRKVNQP